VWCNLFIKIIGSMVVIFSASMIGFLIAGAYRDRPKELRELQSALLMLETEIGYASTPLSEALDRISKRTDPQISKFLKNVKEHLQKKQGYTAEEAWEKSLMDFYGESSLNLEDKAILSNLGKYIGTSGTSDQIKHIKLAIAQLKNQEKKAESEKYKNEKVWRYMGVLAGILFVLLTI